MRSDKKRERELKREEKKENRLKAVSRFLSIIYSLAAVVFAGLLIWLDVLPAKYLYPALAVLLVLSLFIAPVMFSRRGKPGRRKGAMVASVALMLVFAVGIYYFGATLNFFGSITGFGGAREDFYLLVKASSPYEEAKELEGETVGAVSGSDSVYSEARNQLKKDVKVEFEYGESAHGLLDELLGGERKAAFISAASYESLKGQNSSLEEKVKILHKISVKVESKNTTKHVKVTKEPFNVFVSGLDTTGDISTVSRSDVNMIVTVNPKTRNILLTSIPRDYYVTLATKGAKDKLTHSGIYGISETVSTVENFMGIDINYYVKVNYSTVTKLVDAIGGIDVNSPKAFSTHGMKEKYTFRQGQNHLNGSMALAYSRERKSFNDGDIQRNKNQQTVLEAIIKKATNSKTILSEYTSILGAIKDNLETDMEKKDMTSLIKMQLDDMSGWTIEKQSLTGEYARGQHCYALGLKADVVLVDEAAVAKAVDRIMEVQSGGSEE